jgi:3-phosphoshikimate 1-carboxyvinyltransferase
MAATTKVKFDFRGEIPASKSLMNRALIAQSFSPELKIQGQSSCADVQHMIQAVTLFPSSSSIDCGEAGTVFRFMALRASREPGVHRLKGTRRLLERPQKDLLAVLNQLSVKAELLPDELMIRSEGWKKPSVNLVIQREKSSQFSTGLLLSAWDLPFALEFQLNPIGMSDPYWQMTLDFARTLGMQMEQKGTDHFLVPPGQQVRLKNIVIEPDYSSAFAVAVTAALFGSAQFRNFTEQSLQPDFAFIRMMEKMGIPISLQEGILNIHQAAELRAQHIVVRETPDLFPALAILCAFAKGESRLSGAPRLIYKESNRIQKTSELLNLIQVENQMTEDGIIIHGQGKELTPRAFDFDPDQDHRMAMAAGILMRGGWDIRLRTPEIVNKSFPEFWQVMGLPS